MQFEKIERVSVPDLDEILGSPFYALDKGFVRVIDYMGGDSSVVQAARVSYGKGTKHVSEDEGLIRYLMRHSHTTPFEMCQIKFHVRVPMDTWRQWIRTRTSSTNEYSTRYSEAIDDKQQTPPDQWRLQSASNKQGSSGFLDIETGRELTAEESLFHKLAADLYNKRLDRGIAKEQARKDLPLSTYTEAYWDINLHNLLHFLSLRMDSHAQLEIRQYANLMGDIVAKWCPLTWSAFNDYNMRRNALLLTARDKAVIQSMSLGLIDKAIEHATIFGWLQTTEDGFLKPNRERQEYENKARVLGLVSFIPWQH